MYQINHPLPPLVYEEDGTNSPSDHQRIISRLILGLGTLYYYQSKIQLEPLPETPLNVGPGHAVPDVLLYDNTAEDTKVIIEVCLTNGVKNDLRKIIHLIENRDYGILEGFVYNYKTRAWLRYRKGDGGAATASSFSEVMQVDMGGFV